MNPETAHQEALLHTFDFMDGSVDRHNEELAAHRRGVGNALNHAASIRGAEFRQEGLDGTSVSNMIRVNFDPNQLPDGVEFPHDVEIPSYITFLKGGKMDNYSLGVFALDEHGDTTFSWKFNREARAINLPETIDTLDSLATAHHSVARDRAALKEAQALIMLAERCGTPIPFDHSEAAQNYRRDVIDTRPAYSGYAERVVAPLPADSEREYIDRILDLSSREIFQNIVRHALPLHGQGPAPFAIAAARGTIDTTVATRLRGPYRFAQPGENTEPDHVQRLKVIVASRDPHGRDTHVEEEMTPKSIERHIRVFGSGGMQRLQQTHDTFEDAARRLPPPPTHP